ncbi:ribonuclease T2 [Sphingomonas sp.]|uniref:ribonuclease T2 n=1 Tax=Sphingomonas sp. TaxID=28214 RepID=UPI002B75FF73|nr:ribonuclease T2 [Sphingomonas sp.]HTG37837.1 ribonuclease T2 [Sphingomonas sp.]
MKLAVLAALALLTPGVASAQAYRCAIPTEVPAPRVEGPTAREPRRALPIGSYTLAISWGPQYCKGNGDRPSARLQCGAGNRFGFTLHGLWPDGRGREWPQYCRAAPQLSQQVIRRNLCVTPSAQLLQHEYAKHGTCMGVSPSAYFNQASRLFGRLRYPDMQALSRRRSLTVGQFAQAFARANPGLTPAMFRVTTDRAGWLDEVWVCLDTRFGYRACPAHQKGRAMTQRLQIWRGR